MVYSAVERGGAGREQSASPSLQEAAAAVPALIHHVAYKPATMGGSHSISFSALIYSVFTAIYAAGVSRVEIYHDEGRC